MRYVLCVLSLLILIDSLLAANQSLYTAVDSIVGREGSSMVFSAQLDGQWDIYIWDPFSDIEPKQITTTLLDEYNPSISKNRNIVVFEDSRGHLWAHHNELNRTWQITKKDDKGLYFYPSVSNDGESILCSKRDVPYSVYCNIITKGIDTMEFTQFVSVENYNLAESWEYELGRNEFRFKMLSSQYQPKLANDGKKVTFVYLHAQSIPGCPIISEIWETRTDYSYLRQVSLTDAKCSDPCWSPDGGKIVFACNKFNQFDIFTVDVQSREMTRITDNKASDTNPVYSPDGKYIAFVSLREGISNIWLLNIKERTICQLKPFGDGLVPCKYLDWR